MQTVADHSRHGKPPKAFYAHLNDVEGALTKVRGEILFMAWESGHITPITSKQLRVL